MRGRRKYEKMNIINVENITKSYTGRKLFSKASFYVQENEKIENTIQNYFWSGAGRIEVKKYLT